jgi:hypothetical protein
LGFSMSVSDKDFIGLRNREMKQPHPRPGPKRGEIVCTNLVVFRGQRRRKKNSRTFFWGRGRTFFGIDLYAGIEMSLEMLKMSLKMSLEMLKMLLDIKKMLLETLRMSLETLRMSLDMLKMSLEML